MEAEPPKGKRRWYQFSLRTLLIVVMLIGMSSGVLSHFFKVATTSDSIVGNALVGKTEADIGRAYGKPDADWAGYHELGLPKRRSPPPGRIRTLIYDHRNGGTLWTWVRKQGTGWICFESCWFADGVAF